MLNVLANQVIPPPPPYQGHNRHFCKIDISLCPDILANVITSTFLDSLVNASRRVS